MSDVYLSHCPCCDGPAKIDTIKIRLRRAKTFREAYAVKCAAPTPCLSTYDAGGAFGAHDTPEAAAAQWNRRDRAQFSLEMLGALDALFAWDTKRDGILPYRVRDPIRNAMQKLWGAS